MVKGGKANGVVVSGLSHQQYVVNRLYKRMLLDPYPVYTDNEAGATLCQV